MLDRDAGVIAVVSTVSFAFLIWWYSFQSGSEVANFIIVGVALVLVDLLALWFLLTNKKVSKKKGKK